MTSTRPSLATELSCLRCERATPLAALTYVCPSCGGNLQVEYDWAAARAALTRQRLAADADRTLWRYAPLLPVEARLEGPPVGGTPLVESARLARQLGLARVFVKDEGRNPSASLKDRASAVVLERALELGVKLVTCASTGNAASATAALAAAAGLDARIFVPRSAPRAKLAQLLAFGADVLAVEGTYDQAFDLCLEATRRYGWYNRNTGFNPYTREGKKTAALEIAEQLGFAAPDLVVVPTGDGNILSGIWKGFDELRRIGLLDRAPRLLAVQAAGSAAIADAFASGAPIRAAPGETAADSIAVSIPRDGEAALRALRASRGLAVKVSDEQILRAIPALARASGVFGEPAAAAALAGLQEAVRLGSVDPSWTAVLLCTGSGLKDVAAAVEFAGEPKVLGAEPAALDALFGASSPF
jgi:threonine synthase